MEPDPRLTEARFAELAARLTAIEGRLAALEGRQSGIARSVAGSSGSASSIERPVASEERASVGADATTHSVAELLPIIGRTVLIIGGAFVLRAVTEAGILGLGAGAAAGIAYAVAWLALAHRTARKGHALDATLYGLAATIIAFPLLWETTVGFKALSPPAAAFGVVAITAFALAICWTDRLLALAWTLTVAGSATSIALAIATRQLPLFFVTLLAIGLLTLWVGWSRSWKGLAMSVALPANAAVLLLTLIVVRVDTETALQVATPWAAIGVQILLVAIYVGSLVARTMTTHEDLTGGDIGLGIAATVVGLGGAMAVVETSGVGAMALGGLALAMAVGGYAASFTLIDQRSGGRTNFVFYSTLALACALVGCEALLQGLPLTLALALLAVLSAWAGARWQRATLSGHGAIYATALAAASGLGALAVSGFGSEAPTAPDAVPATAWIALPVVVACTLFPVPTHGRTWGRLSGFPKLTFLVVALASMAGLVVSLLAPLVIATAAESAASLSVLRTGVLAAAAVVLGWASRHERFREAGWLVYPLLVAAALKVLGEDFRVGSPATLVVSLTLFGGALILAPRMVSRGAPRKREVQATAARPHHP